MTASGLPAIWSAESGDRAAPLLVLVHGSMDRSAGLLRTARRLDERFRVLRYDRRGYGRSAPHPGPFTISEQVDDLIGLLAGRPAVVFGHSYGGNVALALADHRPELTDAVVVYETPLAWLDWWPNDTAGGTALATGGDPADAAERFMRRLVGDAKWERLPPSTRAARRAEGAPMLAELADLRRTPPWSPERVTVPVLALHGEHGAVHHRAAMVHLGGALPNCRTRMVDDARHFGPNTHPDAVAEAIAGFAAEVGTVGP